MARASTRSTKARPKAKPAPAALDYSGWKRAARAILKEQHGMAAPIIREKDWRVWYITGVPPDAGAEMAARDQYNAAHSTERKR